MTSQHRRIPPLPECPLVLPIADHISRSYPVGRLSFSRAFGGEVLSLTITSENPLPGYIQANLVTSMNSNVNNAWNTIPFSLIDERKLVCHIIPIHTGFHSFRAEFS